jgi:hypothetical protein
MLEALLKPWYTVMCSTWMRGDGGVKGSEWQTMIHLAAEIRSLGYLRLYPAVCIPFCQYCSWWLASTLNEVTDIGKAMSRCSCHVMVLCSGSARRSGSRVEVVPSWFGTRTIRWCCCLQVMYVSNALRFKSGIIEYLEASHGTVVVLGGAFGSRMLLLTSWHPSRVLVKRIKRACLCPKSCRRVRINWCQIVHVRFVNEPRVHYMLCAILSSWNLLYQCMHLGYQFGNLERLRNNVVLLLRQYMSK